MYFFLGPDNTFRQVRYYISMSPFKNCKKKVIALDLQLSILLYSLQFLLYYNIRHYGLVYG
jgi:hypothetical protein